MEHAIKIRGLTKTYKGGVQALKGVDLEVPKGSVFGLLGPNGAGKSTLIKCLLSIVRPTSGTATLLGHPINSPYARAKVGYLPEGHRFPQYLTAAGVCRYFGGLSGLHGEELEKEVHAKLDLVGLSEWADKRVNKFSKGMAQRVGVAQAFLGDPDVVFLDEPTDGVDPVNRQGLHFVIRNAVEKGATVFINSHLLPELEVLCDEVGILNQGEILRKGTVSDITSAVQQGQGLRVRVRTGPIPDELWAKLAERGASREPDDYFVIGLDEEAGITPLIDELRAANVDLFAVTPVKVRLEQAFVELIGGNAAPPSPDEKGAA